MPSNARKALAENLKDISKLIEIHENESGTLKGRRFGLEVINKSAIVLITSFWEAYCEDLAAEAVEHIVKYAKVSDNLPNELKKSIAKELKNEQNELAVWNLADDNWKKYLNTKLEKLQEVRNRSLNTPRSDKIDELFEKEIGIPRISDSWKWPSKMTASKARIKLDNYVTLRCSIAHRGKSSESIKKRQVTDYLKFIEKLAARTGGKVNKHLFSITNKKLYPPKKKKPSKRIKT